MKQLISITLALAGTLAFFSCERHYWEDSAEGKKDGTKNLYPKLEKKDAGAGSQDHSGHDHSEHQGQNH